MIKKSFAQGGLARAAGPTEAAKVSPYKKKGQNWIGVEQLNGQRARSLVCIEGLDIIVIALISIEQKASRVDTDKIGLKKKCSTARPTFQHKT